MDLLGCSRCGEEKPETDFSPQPSNRHRGRSQWCKPCNAAYVRERNADPGRRAKRAAAARTRRSTPEGKAAKSAYNRRYYADNPDVIARHSRSERKRSYNQALRKTPEGLLRHRINSQRRRAQQQAGPGITAQQWAERVEEFLGLCGYCLQPSELTIEHMTPLIRGGEHAMENIIPACASCNSRKGSKTLLESLKVL